MLKNIFILSVFITLSSYAQRPGGGNRGGGKTGEVFGTIADSLSNESLGYVTVIAFKQPENKMIKGMVTSDNGNF
jgi:hypothetical protein